MSAGWRKKKRKRRKSSRKYVTYVSFCCVAHNIFFQLEVEKVEGEGMEAQVKGLGQEVAELEKQKLEFLAKEAEIERLERVRFSA